jgi:alkyl sulfatase BDS1-like metallo-beta-lactamase superfamily hydrolase
MATISFRVLLAFAASLTAIGVSRAQEEPGTASQHFHPKGNPPTEHTIAKIVKARNSLPFADEQDFEEAKKGLIAAPDSLQIPNESGQGFAWDMERFRFIKEDKDFDSIHPSLERQARLTGIYGLFEVMPGIYQVRGYDLSNVTFVKGDTGWIVFDTLLSKEPAAAAWELLNKHFEKRPIVAVIHSHSHADHFGGIRGLVDEADVKSGKIQIIVPKDFLKHAVSENVYAGNAMTRRMFYQYASLLPASPFGYVTQGLGQAASRGNTGMISPTRVIEDDFEEVTIDGVKMVFQNTPGTEAPAEMNTYFPELKALWMAENVTGTLHNIYTLRGAQVRDSLAWSKYINEALYRFGGDATVMFASHHWPRWGNDRIHEVLSAQRDMYANMNNQVLHLANQGVTINEIHNVYELPESLQNKWYCRGYHGSVEHNCRAVINRYLGYWDCNPATLIPPSPSESAPLYVEMMGGAEKIIARGKELYDEGKYLLAVEILNKLVYAEPNNQAGKDLLADCFEQVGYQQENPGVRNSFLAGAYELRSPLPEGQATETATPDVIRGMPTGLFFDYLGIRMDSRKAAGKEFTINLVTPDNDEKYIIELSNATLTNIEGYQAEDADLTMTIDRADLEPVMTGAIPLEKQIIDGKVKLEGDKDVLSQLTSLLIDFEMNFEIMPGTEGAKQVPGRGSFAVGVIPMTGE